MEPSEMRVLTDPGRYPDDERLLQELDGVFPVFLMLRNMILDRGMELEWRYYRDGHSWLGKVTFKKKTVIWMSVWKGFLQATVYMNVKYGEELKALPLDGEIKAEMEKARPSGKLLPCTVRLRDESRLADLVSLADFKLSH